MLLSQRIGYGDGNAIPLLSNDNMNALRSYNSPRLDNHSVSHLNDDDDAQTAYKRKRGNLKGLQESSPLGLRLTKTPALLQLVEEKLNGGAKTIAPCQPPAMKVTKLKAVHFPMKLLKIGLFVIEAKYEADLAAKCYYSKRKLVWEILRKGLKEKIEIQWQKVLALRAVTEKNKLGILEIELDGVPSFFRETELKCKKQTIWTQSEDFTAGQASKYRRHYLQFPTGVLDQHYMTLLQYDKRLLELSQKPFPSLHSPYFGSHVEQRTTHFHFGHDQHLHALKTTSASEQQLTFELPVVSITQEDQQLGNLTPLSLTVIDDPTSPISDLISSSIDESINNQMLQGQQQVSWNQGVYDYYEEYVPYARYLQENGHQLNYELPSHISNMLQTGYHIPEIISDKRHMGNNILQSTSAIADLPMEGSLAHNTNTSTQLDWPNTSGNSWKETLTNANLNPMQGDSIVDQGNNTNVTSMHMDPFVDRRCLFYPEARRAHYIPPEVCMNECLVRRPMNPAV